MQNRFWWALIAALSLSLHAGAATNRPIATVPITFAQGQVMVTARVNGSEPLIFLLDTGFSMTMLRPDVAQRLQLRPAGEITVEGIAGDARAPTFSGADFDIGGAPYTPRRIGSMAGTRRRRDGIIGSGLFRQYVVVIDVAAGQMLLFRPAEFTSPENGHIVPLRFRRSTPIIDAAIALTNGTVVQGAFEIDTGCDSAVCLGHDFTESNHLLDEAATKSSGKYGVGGGARTRSGHLPELRIGSTVIRDAETDFFLEGSPVGPGLAGHIGMEALKRFRITFDYPHSQMGLEEVRGVR